MQFGGWGKKQSHKLPATLNSSEEDKESEEHLALWDAAGNPHLDTMVDSLQQKRERENKTKPQINPGATR